MTVLAQLQHPPSPAPRPLHTHMHSLWLVTAELIMTRASKGGWMCTFPYNKLEQVVIGLVIGKNRAIRKLPRQPAVSEKGHPCSFCQLASASV